MSIFGNRRSIFESFDGEVEPIDVEATDPVEVLDDEEVVESFRAVVESIHEADIEEMEGEAEIQELQAEGAPAEQIEEKEEELVVAQEASVKEIFEKIKAALKKLWEKIKAFFAGIVKFFAQYILSAKDFVKAYNKKLSALSLRNFKAEVWNRPDATEFMNTTLNSIDDAVDGAELKKYVDELSKMANAAQVSKHVNYNEKGEKIPFDLEEAKKVGMEEIVGKPVDSADFRSELEKKLLGEEKHEESFSSGKEFIRRIEQITNDMTKMKDMSNRLKTFEGKINNNVKYAESVANRSNGNSDAHKSEIIKAVNRYVSASRMSVSLGLQATDVWRRAAVKYANSMKFAASKALSHKN